MEQESRWVELLAGRRKARCRQGRGGRRHLDHLHKKQTCTNTHSNSNSISTITIPITITVTITARSQQQFPSVPLGRCCLSCEGSRAQQPASQRAHPQATAEQSGTIRNNPENGTFRNHNINGALHTHR